MARYQRHTLGTLLHSADKAEALAMFVHRYTKEHIPDWAKKPWKGHALHPVQFASDTEWLAHSYFAVDKNGRLDRRFSYCRSNPTWPDHPDLRAKDEARRKLAEGRAGQ